jgi:hypothetical protein
MVRTRCVNVHLIFHSAVYHRHTAFTALDKSFALDMIRSLDSKPLESKLITIVGVRHFKLLPGHGSSKALFLIILFQRDPKHILSLFVIFTALLILVMKKISLGATEESQPLIY